MSDVSTNKISTCSVCGDPAPVGACCGGYSCTKNGRELPMTATEPSVEDCLRELREMFPDAKFITISGDYTNHWNGENRFSTRILIASSWREGQGGKFFTSDPSLGDAMSQVRAWHKEQKT